MTDSKSIKPTVSKAQFFADIYNDTVSFPTIADVANEMGVATSTVINRGVVFRKAFNSDISGEWPEIIRRNDAAPYVSASDVEFDTFSRMTNVDAMATKDECIDALLMMDRESKITENRFTEESDIEPEEWQIHFGTWQEFVRQSGLKLKKAQRQMNLHIANHAASDHYKKWNAEKETLSDVYLKPVNKPYQTMLVFSDVHDKEVDPFALRVMLDTAARVQPDIIVINGDMFDLPEFGRYANDPREWDLVSSIKFVHEKVLRPLRESCPDAQIDFIAGNHECVKDDTDILTIGGWKQAKDVLLSDRIASYDISTGDITYDNPVAVKHVANQPMIQVLGTRHDELLYEKHRIDYDGELNHVDEFLGKKLLSNRFRHSGNANSEGVDLTDDEIRLITWVVMDGCLYFKNKKDGSKSTHNGRIQFKLSKREKIEKLKALLSKMGIEFTFSKATKCGLNKLQPYMIRMYGDQFRYIRDLLDGVKQLPSSFQHLSLSQAEVFLQSLRDTDGSASYPNSTHWPTTSKSDHDVVMAMMITNGIPAYSNLVESRSAFENGLPQYLVCINSKILPSAEVLVERVEENADVVAIQSKQGTLIAMRNGKPSFTGNCRVIKHLIDESPAMRCLLGDLHGWTIAKLLGLDEFEINYYDKMDLAARNKSDHNKELGKNYKVYFDQFMCHHFPQGRNYGVPGVSGHHHKHVVWAEHSHTYGSYSWHQLGAMHAPEASYCAGEMWDMGFAIVTLNTLAKRSTVDYIEVGETHSVAAGKIYVRGVGEGMFGNLPNVA